MFSQGFGNFSCPGVFKVEKHFLFQTIHISPFDSFLLFSPLPSPVIGACEAQRYQSEVGGLAVLQTLFNFNQCVDVSPKLKLYTRVD